MTPVESGLLSAGLVLIVFNLLFAIRMVVKDSLPGVCAHLMLVAVGIGMVVGVLS